MLHRMLTIIGLTLVVTALAGTAAAAGSLQTLAGAQEHGWDCGNPPTTIFGYFHCTPPGKPSLGEAIGVGAPSIELRVYNDDAQRTYAGIEVLLRADLVDGNVPPCPQDNLSEWGFLPVGPGYYACHRFDT
jgi:hypothetical protein